MERMVDMEGVEPTTPRRVEIYSLVQPTDSYVMSVARWEYRAPYAALEVRNVSVNT